MEQLERTLQCVPMASGAEQSTNATDHCSIRCDRLDTPVLEAHTRLGHTESGKVHPRGDTNGSKQPSGRCSGKTQNLMIDKRTWANAHRLELSGVVSAVHSTTQSDQRHAGGHTNL